MVKADEAPIVRCQCGQVDVRHLTWAILPVTLGALLWRLRTLRRRQHRQAAAVRPIPHHTAGGTSAPSGGRRGTERRSQVDRRNMVDLTRVEAGEAERRAAPGIERRSTVDRRAEAEGKTGDQPAP